MRKLGIVVGGIFLLIVGWYLAWAQIMSADVARVKASIDHHYHAIKAVERSVTLKADDVYATGFPFGFRVAVDRPTLSQVWGRESYAISFAKIELESVRADEGRYNVIAPATFDAMYAVEGQAPEKYTVTANPMPGLLLRAQGNSRACPNMPGAQRCDAVAADAPLVSYAVQLPSSVTLDVSLNGQTKQVGFNFMAINLPIFQTVPDRLSHPLTLFVGMLREAMIYQTASR